MTAPDVALAPPDIGVIIRGIEARDPAASIELLDLVDNLCDRIAQTEAEAHKGDVLVSYCNVKGMFEWGPFWASELEAGWDQWRWAIKEDTGCDIGPWRDRAKVQRMRAPLRGIEI